MKVQKTGARGKLIDVCPPRYVYEGHVWVLQGKTWCCMRCGAEVGVQRVN